MKRNSRWALIGLAVLLAAVNAQTRAAAADGPIQPGEKLMLKRAIEIALKYHPRRMESESELGAAGAMVGEARSAMLPQVYSSGQYLRATANGIQNTSYFSFDLYPRFPGRNHNQAPDDFSQTFSSENNYGLGVSVSQFLYDFGRVRGFIDQRKAEQDAAQAQLELTDLNLIFDVAERYYGLLAAQQLVKVYEQAIVQRTSHLHQAQVMAQADLRPQIDVYFTQADLSRSQAHLIQAQNGVDDAKVALDYAMGLAGQAPSYDLGESLGYQPVTARLDALLQLAFQLRPDLKALIDEARAAGAQIAQARSDYFPTARAAAGYLAMGTGTPAANNYFAGLVVTWPMFSGFLTESQVAEARYRRQAVGHAIDDLRQRVIQEVHTAFLNWQASIAVIKKAEQTLDASREELHLAEERYKTGLGNIVELDDAQRRFTGDSADYVNALLGYAVAKAAVDRATAQSLQM